MTDKPIIFSGPMVRALIEGRKTQTRRVLNPQPSAGVRVSPFASSGLEDGHGREINLRYAPGDRLYVREAWRPHYLGDGVWDIDVSYPADGARRRIMDGEFGERAWNWPKAANRGNVTPLHMPRWASRLTLTVTDVRVQRLQDISEADAKAEGVRPDRGGGGMAGMYGKLGADPFAFARGFRDLWNSLHGPDAWDANPWVVALTFTVERRNIDDRVQE